MIKRLVFCSRTILNMSTWTKDQVFLKDNKHLRVQRWCCFHMTYHSAFSSFNWHSESERYHSHIPPVHQLILKFWRRSFSIHLERYRSIAYCFAGVNISTRFLNLFPHSKKLFPNKSNVKMSNFCLLFLLLLKCDKMYRVDHSNFPIFWGYITLASEAAELW